MTLEPVHEDIKEGLPEPTHVSVAMLEIALRRRGWTESEIDGLMVDVICLDSLG